MINADRIHPEWQQRAIGETVYLHPAGGMTVTRFEPNYTMVLNPWGGFTVEPLPGGRTRLFVRAAVSKGVVPWLFYELLMGIPHFVMERQMLLEIKRLAEADHAVAGMPDRQRAGDHEFEPGGPETIFE